jgi:SAM-dependent methyltransferase
MTWGSLATAFHEAAQPRAPDSEVAVYARLAAECGGLLLDVMCGWGRVLAPLAGQGIKVHGVDQSPAMVACCAEKLGVESPPALFRQDVTQLNLPFRYNCAFVAGGAFNFIADPVAASEALARLRAHLVPPGRVLIDCRVPGNDRQRLAAPLVEVRMAKLADGSQIVLRSETTWTEETRMARAQHRYAHRRGRERIAEEHETIRSTWYAPDEIVEIVRAAGYRDVAIGVAPGIAEDGEAFAVTACL